MRECARFAPEMSASLDKYVECQLWVGCAYFIERGDQVVLSNDFTAASTIFEMSYK